MNNQELAKEIAQKIAHLILTEDGHWELTPIIKEALDQAREQGYQEAVKNSEEWMRKQKVWDYYNDCESNFVNDEDVIKYRQYMNKTEE